MPLHGLSKRNPPMETLRQQAGRKQPEGTDLEIRGDNWCEGGGGSSGQIFSKIVEDNFRRVYVCVCL